jgi:hypothetical protein
MSQPVVPLKTNKKGDVSGMKGCQVDDWERSQVIMQCFILKLLRSWPALDATLPSFILRSQPCRRIVQQACSVASIVPARDSS